MCLNELNNTINQHLNQAMLKVNLALVCILALLGKMHESSCICVTDDFYWL